MIEKLVEKENVSFEEARDALKACEGDMIEAIVYLERKGKAEEFHAAEEAVTVDENEEETMKGETRNTANKNTRSAIKGFFRKAKDILFHNSLSITRNGEEKVRIPAWLTAIILVCCFKFSAIVLIISLFLGCRYAFVGEDDLSAANNVMDKASDIAEEVKAQFN